MRTETWIWLAQGLGPGALNSAEVMQNLSATGVQLYAELPALYGSGILTKAQEQRLLQTKPQDFVQMRAQTEKQGIQIITLEDDAYPHLLKNIASMPPVLYVKGNAALMNGHICVGMIGARRPSAYGVEAMRALGTGIAEGGAAVVSGLAAGLDAEAHKAALLVQGATIACIAFGHNMCYPAANRRLMLQIENEGAVISEYPPDTGVEKRYFLHRNRLIAALSQALVVVEARPRSGTMHTVTFAQDFGRDVFAVPGSILSELSAGTNTMLREGAYVAASAFDVLSMYQNNELQPEEPQKAQNFHQIDFGETPSAQRGNPKNSEETPLADNNIIKKPPINRAEPWQQRQQPEDIPISRDAQIVQKVLGINPQGLDDLCRASLLAPGAALAALSELEIAGLALQLPGRRFTINH